MHDAAFRVGHQMYFLPAVLVLGEARARPSKRSPAIERDKRPVTASHRARRSEGSNEGGNSTRGCVELRVGVDPDADAVSARRATRDRRCQGGACEVRAFSTLGTPREAPVTAEEGLGRNPGGPGCAVPHTPRRRPLPRGVCGRGIARLMQMPVYATAGLQRWATRSASCLMACSAAGRCGW